ncbi:hypothetical protein IWQ61_003634 [Dispira simplex]|nr:hypothetical protein IWQ61_003634 [Dispira simplex]
MAAMNPFELKLTSKSLPPPSDTEGWVEFWENYDSAQFTHALHQRCNLEQSNTENNNFLISLLQGSRTAERRDIYLNIVQTMVTDVAKQADFLRFPESRAREMVDVLVAEIRHFDPLCLVMLVIQLLELVKSFKRFNYCPLDMLPGVLQALTTLSELPDTDYPDFGDLTTGTALRDYCMERLCVYPWHPFLNLPLLSTFRDIPLSDTQLDCLIHKVAKVIRTTTADELPPLVYQLLLLSRKGKKRQILYEIFKLFGELERQTELKSSGSRSSQSMGCLEPQHWTKPRLARAASVALLHFGFAVKQDQSLGTELLRVAKARDVDQWSSFLLSVLLVMAKVHRFEAATISLLKSKITAYYRNEQRCQRLLNVLNTPDDPLSPTLGPSVANTLLQLAENTTIGWDQTIPSMIQLIMTLLEEDGASSTHPFHKRKERNLTAATMKQALQLGAAALGHLNPGTPSDLCPLTNPIQRLAVDVLYAIFRTHQMVRTDIVEQLVSQVELSVVRNPSCLVLLHRLIVKFPEQFATDYLAKVKDLFNCFVYLEVEVAEQAMLVVLPLVYQDFSFRDHLMLVLRKHLFSRDLNGRRVALTGLLILLGSLLVATHFTAAGTSIVLGSTGPHGYLPLIYEVLGMLQRCFSQQSAIRLQLYQGLDALLDHRPLPEPVIRRIYQMLYLQLKKYLALSADTVPPFEVSQWDQNQEPLGWLWKSLLHAYRLLPDSSSDIATTSDGFQVIPVIFSTLARTDTQDFDLTDEADYNGATNQGASRQALLRMVMGLYEASIDHLLSMEPLTEAHVQSLLALFEKHTRLANLIKDKCHTTTKGRRSTPKLDHILGDSAVVGLSTVVNALKLYFPSMLFTTTIIKSPESTTKLAFAPLKTPLILRWLLRTAYSHLRQLGTVGGSEIMGDFQLDLVQDLATLVIHAFLIPWKTVPGRLAADAGAVGGRDKGLLPPVTLVVQLFFQSVTYLSQHSSETLQSVLVRLAPVPGFCKGSHPTTEDTTITTTRALQNSLVQLIQDTVVSFAFENNPLYNECLPLVQCLFTLVSVPLEPGVDTPLLAPSSTTAKQLLIWLRQLCEQIPVEDSSLVRALVQLLCAVAIPTDRPSDHVVWLLAQDLHTLLGDVVEDEAISTMPPSPKLAIVTPRTAQLVALFTIQQAETLLTDVEWTIQRLRDKVNQGKLELTDNDDSDGPTVNDQRIPLLEEHAYCCLNLAIQTLVILEQTCLPSAVPIALLQALQKTYKVLTQWVRLKISEGPPVPRRFVGVIKLVGEELSKQLYIFIPQFQARDNEEATLSAQRRGKSKQGKGARGTTSKYKAKLSKESRLIPQLVYLLEQFEQQVIRLSKKCKVDFTQHLRRSTAHDFQIVQQNLILLSSGDDERSEVNSDHESDPKRARQTVMEAEDSSLAQEAPIDNPELSPEEEMDDVLDEVSLSS